VQIGPKTQLAQRSREPLSAQARWILFGLHGEVAVSDDHVIVGQRVHQEPNDCAGLVVMTEIVERECGALPEKILADCGYFATPAMLAVQQRGITAIVPDILLTREMDGLIEPVTMSRRQKHRHPGLQEHRQRMRDPVAQADYKRRKAIVEPVFGILKQQRNLRQFRCRGLEAVSTEWSLASTAFHVTRMFKRTLAG
jgi:Transposase DDE domain